MKQGKTVILGAGHVGSHAAYALAQKGISPEIVLVDTDRDKAVAQALDVDDSIFGVPHETIIRAGDYDDVRDAALVINCIGEGRKPGQTRTDLLARSVEMCDALIRSLSPFRIPGIVISVTNPCDVIADYLRKGLRLDRTRCFGTGTFLDTMRLLRILSRMTGVPRASVEAYCLGEHGDSAMIPFHLLRIGGKELRAYGIDEARLLQETRQSGMTIIEGKQSTEFGIGEVCAALARCILTDEETVVPVSVLLEGEYGESGVHCGVPCRIGRDGIMEIRELALSAQEADALHRSCDVIRGHIRSAEEVALPLPGRYDTDTSDHSQKQGGI